MKEKTYFNFRNYNNKYVMHCENEMDANRFCKTMHDKGFKWRNKFPYVRSQMILSYWGIHKDKTCYNFNNGSFDNINNYLKNGYKILEFSDFSENSWSKLGKK